MNKRGLKREIVIGIVTALLVVGIYFVSERPLVNVYAIQGESSNLEVDLPEDYKNVKQGGEIWFTTRLVNLAEVGRRDVVLDYKIIDVDEEVIVSKSETVAVETQASFVGNLEIPDDVGLGRYFLKVSFSSEAGVSETGVLFNVVSGEEKGISKGAFYLVIGILILSLVILFLVIKGRGIYDRAKIRHKIKGIIQEKGEKLFD